MSLAYEISTVQDSILIRVPRSMVDNKALSRLLDYLEMEAVRQQSQLTEQDALQLSKSVKLGAWEQVKHLFEDK